MQTVQDSRTAGTEKDNGQPAIDIQNVFKAFGEQKVLNGVSFQVRRGETLAVLGRSGTARAFFSVSSLACKLQTLALP